MQENILKHWKTTLTGLTTLLVYVLLSNGVIKPPFDALLIEHLPIISISILSIVLAVYAKDKDKPNE